MGWSCLAFSKFMAGKGRWTLSDLLDFEWLIRSEEERSAAADRAIYRKSVKSALEGVKDRVEQRRIGLLEWFRAQKTSVDRDFPGGKLVAGLSFASTVLGFFMLVSGVGVVLGLLRQPEQAYNLGHFLLATLGLQWLLLFLGVLLFLVRRRATDALGVVGRFILWIVKKASPEGAKTWAAVAKDGGRYRDVCVWTLARIGQWAGVCFNIGLVAGLVGVLMFQDVRFFWETTSDSEPEKIVQKIVNTVSSPWAMAFPDAVPDVDEISESRWLAGTELAAAGEAYRWPAFLISALIVWGLLPRLLLWIITVRGRQKALSQLDFQAPSHRELWRRMSHVERVVETSGQQDEAIIIDVGGLNLEIAEVSPFLRMKLRVHPLGIYQVGVIDESKEVEAYAALDQAKSGVVLMVEGWNLSPKQMRKLHSEIRQRCGLDMQIWFVVRGTSTAEPTAEDLANWKAFVDGLEDAAADVIEYSLVEL